MTRNTVLEKVGIIFTVNTRTSATSCGVCLSQLVVCLDNNPIARISFFDFPLAVPNKFHLVLLTIAVTMLYKKVNGKLSRIIRK